MNPYITKTVAQLIDIHCFEHGRINQDDKEITQRLVKEELRRRFETMMAMLDYPKLASDPKGIYEHFTREFTRN